MSVNMLPYCSAHDEWLIMKLCMYVGYHDANNVSNFGGDPVTQFNVRPPAGRQYGMSISQQPLDRSLPNFQQLLLMSNEGKVESFSSFAYG